MYTLKICLNVIFDNVTSGQWWLPKHIGEGMCSVLLVDNDEKNTFFSEVHGTYFSKLVSGADRGRKLYEHVKHEVLSKDSFSDYITQVEKKLAATNYNERNFHLNDTMKTLNARIDECSNLPLTVKENLLKSYIINHSKRPYLYLAEAIYYSLIASKEKNFSYQKIEGRFIGDFELVTLPPFALSNEYEAREEQQQVWDFVVNDNKKLFVYGLSGIGKSEFAKKLWEMAKDSGAFEYLAWINYQGNLEEAMCSQFLEIQQLPVDKQSMALKRKLADMGERLFLVIDNFYSDTSKDPLLQAISGMPCNVMVTTKEIVNYSGFASFELGPLPLGACINLFKKYYSVENDRSKIESIVLSVGRHTLLVELIAKTADEEEIKLDKLIEEITEKGIDYSGLKVDTNHELLTTEETIAEQTRRLFSFTKERLNQDELDLLFQLSIFKTLPFVRDRIVDWFELKDSNHLKK